jgi:hypothetical protein
MGLLDKLKELFQGRGREQAATDNGARKEGSREPSTQVESGAADAPNPTVAAEEVD